MSHDKSYPSK